MEKKTINITKETQTYINKLLRGFPDQYDSESHVIRCAVINLWRSKNGKTITSQDSEYFA